MKLILGDCLEEMDKLIVDGVKVNAIITDPPYNISKENNYSTMKNKYGKPANETGIDFGNWDKNFDLFSWMDKGYKLLDKNGCMFIFNDWKNIGDIAKYAEGLGMETKDCFRWEKLNPMPRNRDRRYIVDFEMGVWLVNKKSKWTFNRQDEKFERPKFVSGLVSGKEKTKHPTQKPISLMEHLVKIHTNKNDLVLDCFMGSGSTAVACKHLDRNFIGIEKDEKYFKIAEDRINSILL